MADALCGRAAKQLQVPPYPDPLSHSPDPRAWWAAHRPLVLQTGALGPMENNQVSFSGFRLLSVKGDVIDKVHSISINRLEANGYRLPLEDAARPDPPRGYRHSERSRRHHAPDAKSRPAAIWLPQLGVSNVTYRDTQDRLHELWKNDADSGTSNMTAPTAASDPSPYYDAVDRQLVVVYRDTDGKVYSLFWSTGPVGRNLLTPPGAAKAQGNPVGYFDAAGIHHVIYRSSDNHLHELYWAGAGAVGYRDLTKEASAPPATGDPSAYMDTRRGERVVIYRGTDNQVYSLYWTNGPVDYSKLSESVHAPKARGNPAGYYTAHDDVHQVVYRGIDDHLYELYWTGTGGVNPWNLTAIAGAPPADSDPAVYYSAGTNTKQVIYRSADGHLNDLSWVPGVTGPTHVDLTLFALAPPAVGPPAAFTIDGPNSQHVIYRGTDNQIHEITWTTSPSASPSRQDNWRWCNKCQGPFHGGNPTASKCPAGGTHTPPDQSGSVDYILPFSHSLDIARSVPAQERHPRPAWLVVWVESEPPPR